MRRELVVVGLEAERGQFVLDGLVQARRLSRAVAVADACPQDADVVERGKDAEAADAEFERIDVGLVDGAGQRGLDVVEAVGIGVAEEKQRQVRLLRVDEAQPLGVGNALLYVGNGVGEAVREVDADEESHRRLYARVDQEIRARHAVRRS